LLKTSSFMPFFNGDASVIMGASKTNRLICLPRQQQAFPIEYQEFSARADNGQGPGSGLPEGRRLRGNMPLR
jgi:hypothetical protein